MAYFHAEVGIAAPPHRVFAMLADWERQAEWMVDATTVEVFGEQREGVGTRVRAVTRVTLGVPIVDTMVVTDWEPDRLIRVRHLGAIVRGDAWWILRPDASGTRLEWGEDLVPPLGALGEVGGLLLRRPIESLLLASARKLKALVEQATV
ncbi:MAG TPA: SRPBCC family protein [Actinomycetota bacterium]